MSEFIVNTIKGHTANAKVTIDDTCDVEEILNAKGGISVDGGATISDGLTIDSGGINVTGPAVLGGGVNNGLTVNNGGATISGGASINGNAVVTGSISSTTTITAGTGMTVSSGDLNVSGGNIVVSGTVDGVDLQALNNSVSSITTDYLDKTSTSDNNISGSILLDDDKVLALSASGTVITPLLTATNSNGLIASFENSGDNFRVKLGQAGGRFDIKSSTNADMLSVRDNGIITGVSTFPSDITSGAVNGKVFAVSGALASSRNTTGAEAHYTFYNPNGLIASLQTSGTGFGPRVASTSYNWIVKDPSNNNLLKVTGEGIITGVSSVPSDITTAALNGFVINSSGSILSSRNLTSSQTHQAFYNPNGQVGVITTNGTSTSYNTSSDPRLKNFLEMWGTDRINSEWDKAISAVHPFTFIGNPDNEVLGFNAHELIDADLACGGGSEGEGPRDAELGSVYDTTEEAYTEIEVQEIDGEEVEVEVEKTRTIEHKVSPSGVDQAKLVPLLMLKIQQLENRLAQLEV